MTTTKLRTTDTDMTGRVVAAVARTWRGLGEEVDVVQAQFDDGPIDYAVIVPRLRQVECVLRIDQPLELATAKLVSLTDDGWEVSALLPTAALGDAHGAFRGLAIQLQGWWQREFDGAIGFTTPEQP